MAIVDIRPDAGSFRDPRGRVHEGGGRILRSVTHAGIEDFRSVESSGLLDRLAERGMLVPFHEVSATACGLDSPNVAAVLEHPRLPFVSYPYEWGFQALKAAAVLHLEIHLEALEAGVTLIDATAYNVQFDGPKPVFIDHLAFRPYREGEFWIGHRQFCEQFLNPLLLRAKVGIPHNAWYRGALEGITTPDLNKTLPYRKKWSWNVFSQVVLQAHFQKTTTSSAVQKSISGQSGLPKAAFRRILQGLKRWIERLDTPEAELTVWGDYASNNSYTDTAAEHKRRFVEAFSDEVRPEMLWDIGCNTGDYSAAALSGGAEYVVGFDSDQVSLDRAFTRARDERIRFLPLYLDVTNPPPSQGWSQRERRGLEERASCDGVLALALIHHMCIAGNVPLDNAVGWITALAPNGIIEFVPKSDPMVKELLRLREDVFEDYTFETFVRLVEDRGEVVEVEPVPDSDRRLVWYRRA